MFGFIRNYIRNIGFIRNTREELQFLRSWQSVPDWNVCRNCGKRMTFPPECEHCGGVLSTTTGARAAEAPGE